MTEQKKGFAILDHPADVGIEAYGGTLAEAFEQAALGLMSVLLDCSKAEDREVRTISLNAIDREHLLVKWLGEVLYLYDGQHFVGTRFRILELAWDRLLAEVHGESYAEDRHETRMDVKAVTYHQLEILQSEEFSRIRVYLDI